MKLLISWYAYQHDFDREGTIRVKEDGPTLQFHDTFYAAAGYDKHLLLSSQRESDGDPAIDLLLAAIRRKYPDRLVEPRYLDVRDPIDIPVIKSKVEALLLQHQDDEIAIFFSPGTSAMQVSWYVCHTTLGLRTTLLQTRPARFSASKKAELLEIQVEASNVPYSAVLSEKKQQRRSTQPDYLITDSLQPVYERARLVAKAEGVTCLISGESGTGKEHLARYIHEQSARCDRSFVAVNCSALGDQLLESRLFGYSKGAFTDAREDRKGYFDEADGGTLFLDEIGDISPYMQQLLLRVLQEGEITPVGATKSRKVNVRVVGATYRDLEALCEAGAFRWDLYYRLAVVELTINPLRDRGSKEKKGLIDFFLKRIRREFTKPDLHLTQQAQEALVAYSFPGNVRELENLLTSLAVFATEVIDTADLPARIFRPLKQKSESLNWQVVEKKLLERALRHHKGNQRQAWKAVGYKSLNTFKSKLKEYGIEL